MANTREELLPSIKAFKERLTKAFSDIRGDSNTINLSVNKPVHSGEFIHLIKTDIDISINSIDAATYISKESDKLAIIQQNLKTRIEQLNRSGKLNDTDRQRANAFLLKENIITTEQKFVAPQQIIDSPKI